MRVEAREWSKPQRRLRKLCWPWRCLSAFCDINLMSKATATKKETPIQRDSPLKHALRWEASGVLIALIVLCLALSLVSPNFLNTYNLTVVIRQASFVGLVALGQTLVLLLGGIDLSLGACASFSAIVGSLMLNRRAFTLGWLFP